MTKRKYRFFVVYLFLIGIIKFGVSQTGDLTVANLEGIEDAILFADGNGKLHRDYIQAINIGGSDFVAVNYAGTHEDNTRYNQAIGNYGKDDDFHSLHAALDLPISCQINSVEIWGTDLVSGTDLRIRILEIDLISTAAVFFHDIIIPGASFDDDLMISLDFPSPLIINISDTKAHYLLVDPVLPDGSGTSTWKDQLLAIKNISLYYEYK